MIVKFITLKEYLKLRRFDILYLFFILHLVSCQNDYENELKWTLWYKNSTMYLTEDSLYRFDTTQKISNIYYIFFGSNGEFYHCSSGFSNELSCFPFTINTDIYYARLNWCIDRDFLKLPYGEYFIKKIDDSSMVLHQYFVRNRDTTYSNQIQYFKKVNLNSINFKKNKRLFYLEKDYFSIDNVF